MFINYRPININSACNFNCVICDCEKGASTGHTADNLISRMASVPESENIEFVGGELFIRKDAANLVKFAAERFSSVKYNTNGAIFAYRNKLELMLANGLNIVYIKFFSIDPKTHAAATRTDTHEFVLAGFEHLAEHQNKACMPFADKWECGFFLAANLYVHSLTLPTLEESTEYLSRKKLPRLILDFRYSDCISDEDLLAARRSLERSVANGTWAIVKGLPVCAMKGFEEHCGDVYRTQRFIPGHVFIPGVCENCVLYATCGGVAPNLAKKRDWSPIEPDSRIANLDDIVYFHSHIPAQLPEKGRSVPNA